MNQIQLFLFFFAKSYWQTKLNCVQSNCNQSNIASKDPNYKSPLEEDERVLVVSITEQGMKLREKAVEIPAKIGGCISLEEEEAVQLYATIRKLLGQFSE